MLENVAVKTLKKKIPHFRFLGLLLIPELTEKVVSTSGERASASLPSMLLIIVGLTWFSSEIPFFCFPFSALLFQKYHNW